MVPHFSCNMQTFAKDDCFYGYRQGIANVPSDEWRWYVLERRLSVGTECTFTADLETTSHFKTILSSCTVESKHI